MALPPPDLALVDAARQGQDGAWDGLIDTYLPHVLRWCALMGGPSVNAEDAAHDVFIVAMDRVGALRDPTRFASWLVGITRRVLAAHRRKAWIRRRVPWGDREFADPAASRWPEMSETGREVHAALSRLKGHYRDVVVLVDLEEHTSSEVAALLDLPEGTVKSRLRRGRQQMRHHLRDLAPQRRGLAVIDGGRP